MVGNLYSEGSHLKDKAYLIFYMGINVGAALAPIVADSSSRGGDSIRRSSWARSA
jgi:POT family proton-dependent oligopeptide transporter